MEFWEYVMLATVVVAFVLYGIYRLDQYDRNHARRQYRLSLREQAHEDMERINFLYPPE